MTFPEIKDHQLHQHHRQQCNHKFLNDDLVIEADLEARSRLSENSHWMYPSQGL